MRLVTISKRKNLFCESGPVEQAAEQIETILFAHPQDVEVGMSVFLDIRYWMLAHLDKVLLDRDQPITAHEVKVGGAKDTGPNMAGNPVVATITMTKSDFKYSRDKWGLMMQCGKLAIPNPIGNRGNSFSIFQNIDNITNNSVTFLMCSWLPDFDYLDEIAAKGIPKYKGGEIEHWRTKTNV